MDKPLVQGPFSASVSTRDGIVIRRENAQVALSAAEASKLVELLASAMAIEGYSVLPSRLLTSPFELLFNPNRTMEVRRVDQHPDSAGVCMSFGETDLLILLAKQAAAKFIDRGSLRNRTQVKGFVHFKTPDSPIEGR